MVRMLPDLVALTLLRFVRPRRHSSPRAPLFRTLPADIDLFTTIPVTRTGNEIDRVLHVGPLSPESGAADLLVVLASWVEQNPHRSIEICWAGAGDLAGVFEAQPLPSNLTQRFVGDLDRPALASLFAQSSLMVLPLAGPRPPVLEALAAGLVVIGERRTTAVRAIVAAEGPIRSFDSRSGPSLGAAVMNALHTDAATLDVARRAGRSLVYSLRTSDPTRLPAQHGLLVSDAAFP